nr:hypothetical protein Iba_chr08eCG2160 [Ipomoea batatas]
MRLQVRAQMGCFCSVVGEMLQARPWQMLMDYSCIEMANGNGLLLLGLQLQQGTNMLRSLLVHDYMLQEVYLGVVVLWKVKQL